MSVRSKFERKLGFRELGFAYKIPDVGRSLKPFDYVVGVPIIKDNGTKILRFIAIEAKKASGWTLPYSQMLPHQIRALDIVERMSPYSAWLAVGFLDMPKMKLDWDRNPIEETMRAEAYLLPWISAKVMMSSNTSLKYKDVISKYGSYAMEYGPVKSTYKWTVGKEHPIFYLINP